MYQHLLTTLNYLALHVPWGAIAASGILSPLLVGIKKWFSVQSEKVMISLVLVIATLTAALNYLLHTPTHDPSIIAVQGFVLAFMTQPVYFFIVKPSFNWFGGQLAKAAAFEDQIKSAGSAPVTVTNATASMPPANFSQTINVQDFSR